LRRLYLDGDERGLSNALVERIVAAPWFPRLELLRLGLCGEETLDRIAACHTPALQYLELSFPNDDELPAESLAAMLDPERHPELKGLTLRGCQPPEPLPQRAGVDVDFD
jgi:hypothetical protein